MAGEGKGKSSGSDKAGSAKRPRVVGKRERQRARTSRNKQHTSVSEQLVRRDGHARRGAAPKRAPDEKCQARRANKNSYCQRPAGWGTEHVGWGRCKLHGGNTVQGKKAAAKLKAEALAEGYGLPRQVAPQTALMEELARTAGHVAYLGQLVGALEEGQLAGPVGAAGGTEGKTYFPKHEQHVFITMYQNERKHLKDVSKACIEAGIEERRVRIAEQQGQMVAQVIQRVLAALDVPRTPEVGRLVSRELQLVASGEES